MRRIDPQNEAARSSMLRIFIALFPPDALRAACAEVQTSLQQVLTSWRWVPPEQLHVTLKFLGDVPADNLSQLLQHVEQAIAGHRSFTVQACSLGCFPRPVQARLLWMGLNDPDGTLSRLQHCLETALQPLGWTPDPRSFHPHLTLARASQGHRDRRLAPLLHLYREKFFGEFPVTDCQVVQSHLHPHGAVYTTLQTISLHI